MILKNKIVKFYDTNCVVRLREYDNNRVAIELLDSEDESPFCVASVNIPDFEIEKDMVFIKDYSENEGMLKLLVEENIVYDTGETVSSGFVDVPLCIINKEIFKDYVHYNPLLNQIMNN